MKKFLIIFPLLAGVLYLLLLPAVYIIRGSASGVLFWDTNEALLFMTEGRFGVRMSYPGYVLEQILEAMRYVRSPDDASSRTVVIQIAANEVHLYNANLYRYAERGSTGFSFELHDGAIYASQWPRLWKWSGTGFERPTPEEYSSFAAGNFRQRAVLHPWKFDNVGGWSMRWLGYTPPRYQITLGGKPVTIVFSGETWPQKPLEIDLIRPGQHPQQIWSYDGRPRRFTKADYDKVFDK